MSSTEKPISQTFRPKIGYIVILSLFILIFSGLTAICVYFTLYYQEIMLLVFAGGSAAGCGVLVFSFLQAANVFTIDNEGLTYKKRTYTWDNVVIGGVRKEVVNHTVVFVPVAQTSNEFFFIALIDREASGPKVKKLKIVKAVYTDYGEIQRVITDHTRIANKRT